MVTKGMNKFKVLAAKETATNGGTTGIRMDGCIFLLCKEIGICKKPV